MDRTATVEKEHHREPAMHVRDDCQEHVWGGRTPKDTRMHANMVRRSHTGPYKLGVRCVLRLHGRKRLPVAEELMHAPSNAPCRTAHPACFRAKERRGQKVQHRDKG